MVLVGRDKRVLNVDLSARDGDGHVVEVLCGELDVADAAGVAAVGGCARGRAFCPPRRDMIPAGSLV